MLTILYYIFNFVQVTFWFIVSIVVLGITYPFDKSRKWVHECSRYITKMLFGSILTAKRTIEGVENIDPNKAYVMVLNHNSGVDIFAAYKIPLNFRWVSKKEVFRVPFMGALLLIHGDIPIERGNASEAMAKVISDGKLWLSRGASVAIFPEGTRSKNGEIHRFKAGAFSLAKEAKVEILPVVMTGTNTAVKRNLLMNWRNHIAIKVLKPIPVEQVEKSDVKELTQSVQAQMIEALAELRERVPVQRL